MRVTFLSLVSFLLNRFLGAFAKLRKLTVSFVVSVRLPARPHGTIPLSLNEF
jgi:hypothetical protein